MATHHTTFRESLGGQKVTIPNVYEILPEWKPRTHKEYKRAREDVLDPWIEKWVDDKRTAQKLKAADFGLFAAVWATDASFDVLCTAAKYFAWYFVYDDIFDCGSLKYDTGIVGAYREASLQYFKYSLNEDGEAPDLSMFDMELQKGLQCWDEIGLHIHQVCSKETREILCDEMLRYVGSLNNVDSIFEDSHIPSIQHYWDRREATAAVYCVIATIPFICGLDITRDDVNDRPMKDLWRHASYIVHITNDMFSMRKEIGDNQIENLVPVLMLNRSIDCNTAMSQSYEFAVNEAMGLRDAEKRLLTKCENGSKAIITQAFIQGCQDVAMGLVHWSYCGHRYMMPWERDLNGAITFIIQPPGSEPQAASMTQQSTASRGYLQKIQSQLQNASHAFAPFSPLIIMVTISTISAFAFVSRITISIFPGWLARWKQLI